MIFFLKRKKKKEKIMLNYDIVESLNYKIKIYQSNNIYLLNINIINLGYLSNT